MSLKTARRYANALFQISIERDELAKVMEDVKFIHNTIKASRELKLFLRSPIIKPEEKRRALNSIFASSIQPLTGQFFDVVIRKGRERLLDQMMLGFIELYKEYKQILDVEVYSAMELDEKLLNDLRQKLQKNTGKSVELNVSTRPELIGGLAVQIRDTVIDGTVRHKLDQLSLQLKQSAI